MTGVPGTEHRLVFVAGLHRSGTTMLAEAIATHPDASGFEGTGVVEDEGQFLQSVYPIARFFGASGQFGFDSRSHLTEASPLATAANRERLLREWGRHWDLRRPVLVEKSPPNLLKLRFLQALFGEARFVVLMRHPVAVAFATQKWSRTPVEALIEHWLVCHETFANDAPHLDRLLVVRYEDLVADPDGVVAAAHAHAGLTPQAPAIIPRTGVNDEYFARWLRPDSRRRHERLARRLEPAVARFGYSLREPARLGAAFTPG